MHLYILRHADAEEVRTSDAERALTAKGRKQAETVAGFCRRSAVRPDYILTSPFLRARQTADTVAATLEIPSVVEPFLTSGMSASTALRELRAYLGCQSVMIVGHQPDLGELMAALLGLDSPMNVPVSKASLAALDVRSLGRAGASLLFALPPRLMA